MNINDFNKISVEIFSERLKQAKLATTNNLNTVEQHAIKNDGKYEYFKHLIYITLAIMDHKTFLIF